jgi:hypothetical protein
MILILRNLVRAGETCACLMAFSLWQFSDSEKNLIQHLLANTKTQLTFNFQVTSLNFYQIKRVVLLLYQKMIVEWLFGVEMAKPFFLFWLVNRGWMIGCSVVVFDEMEVLFCRLLGLSQGQMLNKATP